MQVSQMRDILARTYPNKADAIQKMPDRQVIAFHHRAIADRPNVFVSKK